MPVMATLDTFFFSQSDIRISFSTKKLKLWCSGYRHLYITLSVILVIASGQGSLTKLLYAGDIVKCSFSLFFGFD